MTVRLNVERTLVFLLRLSGVVTISAFLAVFLPVAWMRITHEWLGLGPMPVVPIVDYLSRSLALLYGFHGVLLLILATDVRRYLLLVRYVGWMELVFGTAMVAVDLHAGLPLAWALLEGPPVAALGMAVLALARRMPTE